MLPAAAFLAIAGTVVGVTVQEPIRPVIEGPWWTVASKPQLPENYDSPEQEPVDFTVWQAADGTWQLWSCIRQTKCGGHTRLFYGWEGKTLLETNWEPQGIKSESRPDLGESPGGLQAPHVVKLEDYYLMAYGDWEHICFEESKDGKEFERIVRPDGKTGVFGEGTGSNSRDPMLICIDGLWHCYYTGIVHGRGYGFCRTSRDLKAWGNSIVVSYGGRVGPNPWQNECPHVVEVVPGEFVYFRNQYYGENQTNWTYYSKNPLNFGIDDDAGLTARLPVAAPEIITQEGKFYIASLKPSLDGIQISRLRFERCGGIGEPVLNFDNPEHRQGWRISEGSFPMIFCDKPHADYESKNRFVIGTCETPSGGFDDSFVGMIESPAFELKDDTYYLFVSGGYDPEKLYVAIVEEGSGRELVRYSGNSANALQRHTFMHLDAQGAQVRVRIVDHATSPWGHINFGGVFREGVAIPVP